MNGLGLYYRVSRPNIRQFARLAINSNEQHPAHHVHESHTTHATRSPVAPSQLHSTLLGILSSHATAAPSFPAPLVALIVEYALCSSIVAAEADGAMHEYEWRPEGSQATHWRALHTDAVTAVSSLPDGQHCASGSHDGRIIVSRQVVAAADGGTCQWLEVRRIEHKYAVHTLQGALAVDASEAVERGGAAQFDCSPPQLSYVLVVGSSAGAFVYCPTTGRMLHELSGHTNRVSALCVLPGPSQSASVVVSASWDGCCRVWSLQSAQCECVLRGRAKPLTCVAAVDRGCVVAGDVAGGVLVWRFAGLTRSATGKASHSDDDTASLPLSRPPPTASSIASIQIAGYTSAAYVFRSPDSPAPPLVPVPALQPSSHFSASSAATRSVLSVPSSGLLWVGSDDGLRLFAPSDGGEWRCVRHIVTPSLRGSSSSPVHSLQWLSSYRLAVGMSTRTEVWNCQPLLELAEASGSVDCAERVQCEWAERGEMSSSVRSVAVRRWLDITQPTRPPAAQTAANKSS